MFKVNLIDDDYLKVLNLFDLLLDNQEQSKRKAVIVEQLDISDYLLARVYVDLITLLAECFDDSSYETYEDKDRLSLTSTYGLGRHIFFNYLLKKSHKYQMLLLIGRNRFVVTEYSNRYFISTSKVYKELGRLKENLKKYGVSINTNNELSGDEYTIRSLMMTINGIYDNPNVPIIRIKLTEIIKAYYQKETPYNLVNKVSNYISIIKHRRKYSLPKYLDFAKIPSDNGCPELVQGLQAFIQSTMHLSKAGAELEAKLLGTMIHGHISNIEDNELSEDYQTNIVDPFLLGLKQQGFDQGVHDWSELKTNVNQVVYQAKHPISPDFESADSRNMQYYLDMFPEFYDFVYEHICHSKEDFYQGKEQYLIYHLLLVLVSQIAIKDLFDKVVICIDFQEDVNYHAMLKNDLGSLRSGEVSVTHEYSKQVDLIITDMPELYEQVKEPILIWKAPPTEGQWQVLAYQIVKLRKKSQS